MGLNCSHGAWDGPYSKFNRFRQYVGKACGGSFPPHDAEFVERYRAETGEEPDARDVIWDDEVIPADLLRGGKTFLEHSDCDGEISPADCIHVARFLRWAAPLMPAAGSARGPDDPQAWAERFASGCDRAAMAGEPLTFG